MIQSILAKILTEKRYERQIQEIKNQKHKKISKKRTTTDLKSTNDCLLLPSAHFKSCLAKIFSENCIKINLSQETTTSQLLGDSIYESKEEEDINTIMQQCNVTRDQAIKALHEANGDLVTAVMNLAL